MGGWTNVTAPVTVFTPEKITNGKVMLQALDTSSTKTRTVNGTVRLADQSRTGTPRQMQPGRAYLFAGVSDEVTVGDLGVDAQHVSMRVKLAVDNQELLTFQDSTATAIKVSAGVLTFGGSLTASAIYVDGVAVSAATAGATLNDNGWHTLGIDLTAIDASDLLIGSDSSAFGNFYLSDLRFYTRTLTAAEAVRIGSMGIGNADIGPTDAALWYKCDEGGTVLVARNCGSLGDSANGTIVPAAAANFHNATENDVFSFQNEVGYFDDTAGATAAYIPRDEANPSQDVLGNALQYSGQAPHDPILSSKCLTLNGTNEHITVPHAASQDFTIAAWIKTSDSDNAFRRIYTVPDAANQDLTLCIPSDATGVDVLHFRSDNLSAAGVVTGTTNIVDGEWHHVAVTKSGSTITLYVDGVQDAQETRTGTLAFSSGTGYVGRFSTATHYFDGQIHSLLVSSDVYTPTQLASLMLGVVGDADAFLPLQSGIYGYQDVSGNQRHGTPTITSEATAWANQQNKVDTLVTDGATIATRYSGTGEYYAKGSRLTSGELTMLSCAAWVRKTAGTSNRTICGEYAGSWMFYFSGVSELRVAFTNSGVASVVYTSYPDDGKWHHVAMTYDGASNTVIYVDGVAVKTDTSPKASIANSASPFQIGTYSSGTYPFSGSMSAIAVEQGTVWDAATVAAIKAGTIPPSAWYFRDGNGTEFNNALTALTPTGDPDRIIVPAGIMPVTVGPGVLMPGQSGDLAGGQANSPYAQQLADLLADTTYDQADDDEINVQFARVRTDGDDRIVTAIPGLTGTELASMQDYTT